MKTAALNLDLAYQWCSVLYDNGDGTLEDTEFRAIRFDGNVKSYAGTIDELAHKLANDNREGFNVFAVVNRVSPEALEAIREGRPIRIKKDGTKQWAAGDEDIIGVRSVFTDRDKKEDAPGRNLEELREAPLAPSVLVRSSESYKIHGYWPVVDVPVEDFSALQLALAKRFDGDKTIHNPSRIMRVPGFLHLKGAPIRTELLEANPFAFTRDELLTRFEIDLTAHSNGSVTGLGVDGLVDELLKEAQEAIEEARRGGAGRHETLTKLAKVYRLQGLSREAARFHLLTLADSLPARGGGEKVPASEIDKILNWTWEKYSPKTSARVTVMGTKAAPSGDELPEAAKDWQGELDTDRANAKRLEILLGEHAAWTPGLEWKLYDGGVWRVVTEQHMQALAQDLLCRAVYQEASDTSERAAGTATKSEREELGKEAERLLKWAKRCEMKRTIHDALELFRSRVLVEVNAWDADPWLLNLENGVLELRTQTLRKHRPEDRMTKRAPVSYVLGARHWAVDILLELLQRDNREEFLRRALGSSLAGIVMNELLFYLVGLAGTGKSTLMEGVMTVLGDYAATVDTRTFIASNSHRPDGPRSDLIALRGARLAVGRELPKYGRLNATDVKALTGQDTITARAPYGRHPIEFRPVFKLFVHSNYDLRADWDDDGVRRRLMRIPFNAKPEQPDPEVKQALLNDPTARSALLNWLLTGLVEWIADGYKLEAPKVVQEATQAYWDEMDPFAEWADERLDFDGSSTIAAADLFSDYQAWCEKRKEKPKARQALGMWLSKWPGLEQTREGNTRTRCWKGVNLRVGTK